MSRRVLALLLMCMCFNTHAASDTVKAFFRNPDFLSMVISPDGEKLATTVRRGTEEYLVITSADGKKVYSTTGYGENHIIRSLVWVNKDRVAMNVSEVVGFLDRSGEWKGIFALNFDGTKKAHLYTPLSKGYVDIVDPLVEDEKFMLVVRLREDGAKLQKMNVYNGDMRFAGGPSEKIDGLAIDADGKVKLAVQLKEQEAPTLLYLDAKNDWQSLQLKGSDEFTEVAPIAVSNDGSGWFLSNHQSGLKSLYKLNTASGEILDYFQDEFADIDGRAFRGSDRQLLGIHYQSEKDRTIWLNADHRDAELIRSLEPAFRGQTVAITSYANHGAQALVRVTSDTNPGEYYLVDTATKQARFVARSQAWIDRKSLTAMEPVTLKARDGQTLHGYLTKPKGYAAGKPVPMVVVAHGGPHGIRDEWGYNPEAQFLASQGYAVMQVNYRGSGGYGRSFLESGYRKWGREMQDDVTDATLWAVEQGIADKDRLCLYGGSYGGYAALQGAVREPDLYKCVIGYVGVYDLTQFTTCGDIPDSDSGKRYLSRAIGTDIEEQKRFSPAYNAEKIKAAVFLAHGSKDVRVPMCQGETMKKALESAGNPPIWMVRPEGHGYQQESNRFDFYGQMESFLKDHIGH